MGLFLFIFIYYMRCGVAKAVARVGNAVPDHCSHGIGYLLARSALYEALAVLAAAYPADVILVSHTLSIQWCAVRARRRVLPIRRSVRTWRWSSPDVGKDARGVVRMGFDYSYSIYAILSLPTDVSVLVVPPTRLSPCAECWGNRHHSKGGYGRLLFLFVAYCYQIVCSEKRTYTLHQTSLTQMPFLITEVVSAC